MGLARTAALYMRMSTEKQDYSISHQRYALDLYAAANDITVVREYCDEGKSGLALKGRDGLRQLLDDVISARASFNVVMVYDVSRWGRFQDVDEAAHYEFLCRNAGITVLYCAEQFSNDGSALASMVKTIKRAMAAEYSRELSDKVFKAQCRFIRLGFKQGGSAGYGLRRVSIAMDGKVGRVLARGERKTAETDRVIFTIGPAKEVAVVRQIYRWFVRDKMTYDAITRKLNELGVESETGRAWRPWAVKSILTKEKYAGHLVFNKCSGKLGVERVVNATSLQVRCENAFPAVISPRMFHAAQKEARERTRLWTNEELLEGLRRLFDTHGKLSYDLVNQGDTPSDNCYRKRFGTLSRAFALAGAGEGRYLLMAETKVAMTAMLERLIDSAAELARLAGATVSRATGKASLLINGTIRVRLVISRRNYPKEVIPRWRVVLHYRPKPDFLLIAQMDESNSFIRNYFLLPVAECRSTHIWLRDYPGSRSYNFFYPTLEDVFGVCSVRAAALQADVAQLTASSDNSSNTLENRR